MVLGKRWLFFIGNGAEIRLLEMGRKGPAIDLYCQIFLGWSSAISNEDIKSVLLKDTSYSAAC